MHLLDLVYHFTSVDVPILGEAECPPHLGTGELG